MALTEQEIKKLILDPTQANWRKPYDLTPEQEGMRLGDLARYLKVFQPQQLQRALAHLRENRGASEIWPGVKEWKDAISATAEAPSQRTEQPWIALMKEARKHYRNEWAETTLAQDMDGLGVGSEFRALVTRMIYDRLRKGVPLDHMVVPGEYLEHLKRKGESFLAAKGHRLSDAYAKTHGKPLKTAVNG